MIRQVVDRTIASRNCTVAFGEAGWDMCVCVKHDLVPAQILFDGLACRGSNGKVKLSVTDTFVHERDMLAWRLWIQDSNFELILKDNNLGPRGCKMLARLLPLENVMKLDVSNNTIGNEGFRTIVDQLVGKRVNSDGTSRWMRRSQSFQQIRVRENNISDNEAAMRLFTAYQNWDGTFDGNAFNGKRVIAGYNGNLFSMETFRHNMAAIFRKMNIGKIPEDTMDEAMRKTFESCLRDTHKLGDPAEYRGRAFRWCSRDYNMLHFEWAFVAAIKTPSKSLRQCHTLEFINLQMKDTSRNLLSHILVSGNLPRLYFVNLRNNELGDAQAFVDMFEETSTVKGLYLEGNLFSTESKAVLHRCWAGSDKPVANGSELSGLYL